MNEEEVKEVLSRLNGLIDNHLDKSVPSEIVEPIELHKAIRWSLFAGGKRFRPSLLMIVGTLLGSKEEELLSTACAIEMIHTYSLIHDDLPSMDNDDMRRGRPTCHIKFGEATAILAGDALQALAFKTIAEDNQLPFDIRVRLISELARAAGTPNGMVAGQAFDIGAEAREITTDELEQIHHTKTGAMITVSARSGAIIAGVDEETLSIITQFANSLGLLFQITDDILDITATAEDLGKTPGKDRRSQKATYPSLYGIDQAREKAQAVYKDACFKLNQIKSPSEILLTLTRMILERHK
jgi:geranylgeranyl diphosphate synthase, type II